MSGNISKVAKFKQHCDQLFQDDLGGKSSLVALEGLVEQDMANTYKIPVTPILPENSSISRDKQKQLRGLWHQLTQHLVDLGYISESTFMEYLRDRKEILEDRRLLMPIVAGVEKYLMQETAPEVRQLIASSNPERPFTQFWIEQHFGVIVEAIAKYTSFDGTLAPPQTYEVGEDSCYGRSLAFRMRVIFAMDAALDNAYVFDQSMIKFTFSLKNILKQGGEMWKRGEGNQLREVKISNKFWRLVCDLDQLFDAFFKALPEEVKNKAYAITYTYNKDDDDVFKAANYELIYQNRTAENKSGNSRKWNVNRIEKASKLKAGIYANIACRLLQLKLWQTSFYLGAIDGDWGKMSHDAVLNAYEHEQSLWKDEVKTHAKKRKFQDYSLKTVKRSVFHKPKKGIIAIDLEDMHMILQNYVSSQSKETASGENEMALIEKLRKDPKISDEKLDQAILTEKSLKPCYDVAGESPRRRVSYVSMNNKSFFKGLLRGIGKIVKWIIGAFKKVLGLIFAFAKAIIDRIRKGFQLFAKGFRYLSHLLLGRPITAPRKDEQDTSPRIYTRFQLDFDAMNVIPSSASSEQIQAHAHTLNIMRESMIFFIDVVLFVIKAISKLSRPGGWVSLGVMIFKWLFKRVEELFQLEPKHEWSEEVA